MSAASALPAASLSESPRADPVEAFENLCWAKAYRYGNYQVELQEVVDDLMAIAVRQGVVGIIGVDQTQSMMAEAFRPWRD